MASVITSASIPNIIPSSDEKYAEGMRLANDALQDMLELVNMPDFENHEGWKQKSANKNDIVFSKYYALGKIFTMRTIFDFPLQPCFAEHWENFADITKYNKNISSVKIIDDLAPNMDVVYYAMKDFATIKGREFLMCRTFRSFGDEIIEAARSFDFMGAEHDPQKIRGHIILAGGRFRICPVDSAKTIVDYVMCVDFKEKNIPKIIIDATMSTLIMQDAEFTRKQIEKLKQEAV
uniref:START domain-containing protein n=1 Tax=Onchocerca volvulus TaxID=6282 RepID=A0A8R1TUY0_ONCVO